jgi:hypothetical protein
MIVLGHDSNPPRMLSTYCGRNMRAAISYNKKKEGAGESYSRNEDSVHLK